jgi:alanine racemase
MRETSQLQIDLSAIDQNVRLIRRIVGRDCAICPIVKADAYGMGTTRIAKQLVDSGADMLAVYTPEQARELARHGLSKPVLVLMPVREVTRVDDLYRWLICGQLHLAVHDAAHLRDLIALAERFGATIPVQLEVDTGMTRGGCSAGEVQLILGAIAQSRWVHLAGLFTHFANAHGDAASCDRQLTALDDILSRHASLIPRDCLIHAANTYATLRHERFHRSMVRIGLAWAGYGMESIIGGEIIADGQSLQPILTWTSSIVQVKSVEAGTRVGYGSRWTARRRTLVGLVPVGYADGYPIGLGAVDERLKGASVAIVETSANGTRGTRRFAPVIGQVNMDQITVDLTDLAGDDRTIEVGASVELITPDAAAPNHLPRLASMAGTIPTEMMCRLNPRIQRSYVSTGVQESKRAASAASR